ncbi:MAG: hypothetical protein J6Z00_02985 [Clostridia bacterium]|nr:hypothetical protein [Clostridia bacterium]
MKKKWLLQILLVLAVLLVICLLLFRASTKYNHVVVNTEEWNELQSSKTLDTNMDLQKITFNDNSLLIDSQNSTLYYSVVDYSSKYNPSIAYTFANAKYKIAISGELNDEVIEKTNAIKVMFYNTDSYKIYNLVVTNYPLLNVQIKDNAPQKKKIPVELEVFDNHVNSPRRLTKSAADLQIKKQNEEYTLSLKKESLGRNERENPLSLFGLEKRDAYVLKAAKTTNEGERYVQFFINNQYLGLYSFGFKNEGSVNPYERNRENNR